MINLTRDDMDCITLTPWSSLVKRRLCRPNPSGQFFAVEKRFFAECLRPLMLRIRFDEAWYLEKYSDVRKALTSDGQKPGGEFWLRSAHEHYLYVGFFENRLPYKVIVDEKWYLSQHDDIRDALKKGTILSVQLHFEDVGFAEGRLPFENFEFDLTA